MSDTAEAGRTSAEQEMASAAVYDALFVDTEARAAERAEVAAWLRDEAGAISGFVGGGENALRLAAFMLELKR